MNLYLLTQTENRGYDTSIKGSPWDVRGTSSFIEEVKVGET